MRWTRGRLEVGMPAYLESYVRGPVDVAVRGKRCVLEYLGWDRAAAGGHG